MSFGLLLCDELNSLTSETIEGSALALEGVDNVKSSDGLTAGVLSVSD